MPHQFSCPRFSFRRNTQDPVTRRFRPARHVTTQRPTLIEERGFHARGPPSWQDHVTAHEGFRDADRVGVFARTVRADAPKTVEPSGTRGVAVRIVVGMTGATGSVLGVRLLEVLKKLDVETHLVLSDWARATLCLETTYSVNDVRALATHTHSARDLAAAVSSGSFLTDGMVVCPCSMKTLAAIRTGFSENLISRAADVTLKERRRLVLVAREAPLSEIHLENMHYLSRAGAVIFPPTVAYYAKPRSVDDVTDYIVGRVIDQLGIPHTMIDRWKSEPSQGDGHGDRPGE